MQQRDEDKLQMALWDLICLRKKPGVLAWAVCNNPRSARDGARYKKMGLVAGCPDLHFLVNGRYQTLEVKTEKGKASLAQLAWIEALGRRDIIADIGYGWDECVEILERRGVLLPGKYGKANAGPADKGPKKRKPAVRPSLEPGEFTSLGNAVPLATQRRGSGNTRRVKGMDRLVTRSIASSPKFDAEQPKDFGLGSDDPKGLSI